MTIHYASWFTKDDMDNLTLVNRQNQSKSSLPKKAVVGKTDAVQAEQSYSHFQPNQDSNSFEPSNDLLVWKTCMRSVFLMDSSVFESFELNEGDEVHHGEAAYAFLLEVLCGLRSPMVGETEILGQFKEFLKSSLRHPLIQREMTSINRLLQDAKLVREQYLQQLGCHSYGSLSRRLLKGVESAVFVGAGQLVSEILPWLKEIAHLEVISRDELRMHALRSLRPHMAWSSLAEHLSGQAEAVACTAMIVCAPISNEELLHVIRKSNLRIILDLRGEYHFEDEEVKFLETYYSLRQFMDSIREERAHTMVKVQDAKAHIAKLAEERRQKAVLRPLGWDDLCY